MAAARIYVPRDTTAVSVGANEVALAIAAEAKRRGADIELVRNGSWGACWLEPLVEVQLGEQRIAYGNVEPGDVPTMFDAGLLEGGEHARRLGPINEIDYLIKQERWTFWRCGLVEALSLDDFLAHQGFKALQKAWEIGADTVIEEVIASGLRGRGGAGFPSGIKWRTVADAAGDQKYIACNADEGDTGTFSDRILMEGDPYGLIEALAIAGFAVGANKAYIYLRSEYPLTHTILTRAIATLREAGWLGKDIQGSGFDFEVELHLGAGSYVCGEETAMLESLEGRKGIVRSKPPLPAISGLFGAPTLVNNVVTLASVPNIVNLGGERYAGMGVNRSKGTLAFQLGGNVKRGGLVERSFGVSLRELVEDYGGGTASGRPIKAVQVGGPLGTYLSTEELDTPLDYEAFVDINASVGHGGIVVFDDTADMAELARFAMEFCAIESCGKCTPCRIGSTRGVELIDRMIKGEKRDESYDLLIELCDTMEDASLCAMGGMTPNPVRSVLHKFADDFATRDTA
jgi:formate dehydrogenase iron-sulfur subunit